MSLPQGLIERELGRAVLKILGDVSILETLPNAAQSTAVQVLEEIQAALSDPGQSDFEYVEAIVDILHEYGISTNCHDF